MAVTLRVYQNGDDAFLTWRIASASRSAEDSPSSESPGRVPEFQYVGAD